MKIAADLDVCWREIIGSNKAFNDFRVEKVDPNDPAVQWQVGDTIRAGLKLNTEGQPAYFAYNLTTNKEIGLMPAEELIGDGFVKCFLPHRALRPQPPTPRQPGRILAPSAEIDQCGYRCQDPRHIWSLLQRNPLVILDLPSDHFWACYYNFSPFELRGHFVWLPIIPAGMSLVIPHYQQVLTQELLRDAIDLFEKSQGLLFFFNSLHAGASQNHFHLQAVNNQWPEKLAIRSNEINDQAWTFFDNYPINGLVYRMPVDPDRIFDHIQRFCQAGHPYNLIMTDDHVYLIPRDAENELVSEFPFGVLAAMELSGRLIITDLNTFQKTDYDLVKSAFKKIGLMREMIEYILAS